MPLVLVAACSGDQSALAPAGVEAERIATLFWTMLFGGGIIWLLVIGAAVYASRLRPRPQGESIANALMIWGGVVAPTLILTGLLTYGLVLMPALRAPGDGLRVNVSGEQWWWRVSYVVPGRAEPVTSANEIRLPIGRRIEIELTSPDVIHSFWIPSLGGKVDMIPGRVNRLVLEPTRAGEFRGICAEFCGTSHALMAFSVVTMEEAAFADWLAREAQPALRPGASVAGQELFLQVGCGACHAIRGTEAAGAIGPDLTHLASRPTLAAGALPNTHEALVRWITQAETVKPGSLMPSFGGLPDEHVEAIATYLAGLK